MANVYSLLCFGGVNGKSVTVNSTTDYVTLTNHGLRDATPVVFRSGTLPTVASGAALALDTAYYAKWISSSTFELYRESGLSTKLNFTSTGSSLVMRWEGLTALLSTWGSRWGASGVRVYDSISAFNTTRGGACLPVDTEICEIAHDWDDYVTADQIINMACYSVIFTPTIDDVSTSAAHAGVYGAGYAVRSDTSYVVPLTLGNSSGGGYTGTNVHFTDMSVKKMGANYYAVQVYGVKSKFKNNFVIGPYTTGSVRAGGIYAGGNCAEIENNVVLRFKGDSQSYGVMIYQYALAPLIANNVVIDCYTGWERSGAASVAGWIDNNMAFGCTTNWGTKPAGLLAAKYNMGESGNTPWDDGGTTALTNLVSGDFTTYNSAGNSYDVTPAATSSHQVDTGMVVPGADATDMLGNERPAYNNGSAEYVDIGPIEKNLGYTRPAVREITVEGFESGTQVKIFDTTTQDVLDSTTSGTTITYDAGVDGVTVDVTVLMAGKIALRFTDIALTAENYTITVTQVDDQNYVASSGLTYGTNLTYDATVAGGNKYLKWNAVTSGRNLYSAMMEAFIAETSLENIAFDFEMNGPNGLILKNGAESRGYTTAGTGISNSSLDYLIDDGLMYLDTSGTATAIWPCITTQGVPSGKQARYQQVDGSGTTNAESTGDVNQLVQAYGDASHGNFDKRSHMVWKVQSPGYDEARVDLVAIYGNMEGQGYIVPLVPIANGIADASGITNLTFTDHGGSPVTWNGKVFGITIEDDDDSHSGEEIIQWIRNANNFNRHDLVQENGTSYKTVRGYLEGDSSSALKGVRVVRSDGTTAHYDFNLFTADDGTTYAPTIVAAVQATAAANTRFVLYNVTQDAEIDNSFSAGGSYSYTITTEADDGDTLDLYYFKEAYEEGRTRFTWGGVTQTVAIEQSVHAAITTLRTALGISDYTTITEFALDITGAIEIDADDADGASQKARLAIWYNGILTTEDGARHARGAISILATNQFRINVDVLDLTVENISVTQGLQFTDIERRLWRSDNTPIYAATSTAGSIENDYSGVPDTVETGVSGLTAQESADLSTAASSAEAAATAANKALTVPKFLALK